MGRKIQFFEHEVDAESVIHRHPRKWNGTWPHSWKRIEFDIPDNYSAPQAIEKWIFENTLGRYSMYEYTAENGNATKEWPGQYRYHMVIAFENPNEALLFKLKGGHRAFELSLDEFA